MQQMNSQEDKRQIPYGQYEGTLENDSYTNASYGAGQKLDNEDEQFADILVRRMKQEMGDDLAGSARRILNARMIVAIASLCVLVLAFALLVFAVAFGHVSGDGMGALGGGSFGIVVAIIAINGYFNWASIAASKQENTKRAK